MYVLEQSNQKSESQAVFSTNHKPLKKSLLPLNFQTKLKIHQSNDPLELEADKIAERILRTSTSRDDHTVSPNNYPQDKKHRENSGKVLNENEMSELRISRKTSSSNNFHASEKIADGINRKVGSGKPLNKSTKEFMEAKFGHDFGAVRIHDDSKSKELAGSVNARAFTVGSDIFFGKNESNNDRKLMAHELVHVVQQNNGINKELFRQKDAGVPLPADVPSAPQPNQKESDLILDIEGKREPINPKKITKGIWWLNGAIPTLHSYYPTEVTLNTGLSSKGTFFYKITKGAKKLAILENGKEKNSIKVKDNPNFMVRGIGASSSANDVEIQITHFPQGKQKGSQHSTNLHVRAPYRLTSKGCSHRALGTFGYGSKFRFEVFDNFGLQMPYIDVNEDFTSGRIESGVSSEWNSALAARKKGGTIIDTNASFADNYQAIIRDTPPFTMTPKPQNPQNPLGNQLVGTFTHWWYVGSKTSGKGIKVSEHFGRFFSDHGQYFSFLSPPYFASKPVNCPP